MLLLLISLKIGEEFFPKSLIESKSFALRVCLRFDLIKLHIKMSRSDRCLRLRLDLRVHLFQLSEEVLLRRCFNLEIIELVLSLFILLFE
jgi:hypothetical protein